MQDRDSATGLAGTGEPAEGGQLVILITFNLALSNRKAIICYPHNCFTCFTWIPLAVK